MKIRARLPRLPLVAGFCVLALAGLTWAFVHDGRSAALEAATEELTRADQPYHLREDWWQGETSPGEVHLVRVQLFERNEYAFWLGFSEETARGWVHLYDEDGHIIAQKTMQKGQVAATHVQVETSGHYYIRLQVDQGPDEKAEWAVLYAYR